MPPLMGHWLQVSQDDKLDKETEDVLGTEKYMYRDYIQVDRAGADLVAFAWLPGSDVDNVRHQDTHHRSGRSRPTLKPPERNSTPPSFDQQVKMINDCLKNKTPAERKEIVTNRMKCAWTPRRRHSSRPHLLHRSGRYRRPHPRPLLHRRRLRALNSYTQPTWQLGPDAAGKIPSAGRFDSSAFEDSTGNNRVSKCVAYVFHTNGHYESDPLGVRQTLEDLTERYGYYAKIELMTLGEDTDVASAAMTEFLTVARPQIELCFPDWQKLKHSHA